jgi:hypothetical protein
MEKNLKPAELPKGFGQTRGSEHEVWLADDGTHVIKATHAGEFGRKFGPDRFATLPEYLERIALTVSEFGIDWQVIGTHGRGRSMRVVSRQQAFRGSPPVRDAIRDFMLERGFKLHHTRFGDAWFRSIDGILVSDAEPKNAASTPNGIMPFDFLIALPSADLLTIAHIA